MTGADLRLWGLPLDEARERARAAGWHVECVLTRPPWPGSGGGRPMVVGQRVTAPGRLLLIYAHEEYRRQTEEGR
ncbi:MAG: hypothetical protein QME93_01980 [Bacillota bacterium]|nr:hypothetical protein [Bacillota bacterium]MDI7248821.1 hypothetical protein [Bacillota bacterium]